MTYTSDQRFLAIAWKTHTTELPEGARAPTAYLRDGPPTSVEVYFCLPPAYAAHNLLPDVRKRALKLFKELGIPWHAGVDGGPGNHLLSSQVQCVNALTLMVDDPSRIGRAFADVVDVGEVLQVEPGRYLTFEYIGPTDFFGEAPGGQRVRGARCTSVDAAFLHRAPDGLTELVLVEWKYTESYRLRSPEPVKDEVRRRRYAAAVDDPDGPLDGTLLPFDLLLDEPFYQLVRQQLLAHALERAGVADRVRVVHVLPPENEAYQQSLARPEPRALGATVSEVWQRLLRRPDRFTSMDPAAFLAPDVTSEEYVLRYAPDVVWDEAGLLAALHIDYARDVDDVIDFEGEAVVDDDGVELIVGRIGTPLLFPFRLDDLLRLADEVEREDALEREES